MEPTFLLSVGVADNCRHLNVDLCYTHIRANQTVLWVKTVHAGAEMPLLFSVMLRFLTVLFMRLYSPQCKLVLVLPSRLTPPLNLPEVSILC